MCKADNTTPNTVIVVVTQGKSVRVAAQIFAIPFLLSRSSHTPSSGGFFHLRNR
ncbi:hypothetical protein JCM18904_734 [Vibrio sp. JCM 18904]|nr:hypothetical protein JCM18904_734 [Vibrio sp. JCM 18904]